MFSVFLCERVFPALFLGIFPTIFFQQTIAMNVPYCLIIAGTILFYVGLFGLFSPAFSEFILPVFVVLNLYFTRKGNRRYK
jgi:hypothetical protein